MTRVATVLYEDKTPALRDCVAEKQPGVGALVTALVALCAAS